jgi:hypothetical protein
VCKGFVEILVDRLTQPVDVDVDHIGLIEMIVPDALEQHGARYHLPL